LKGEIIMKKTSKAIIGFIIAAFIVAFSTFAGEAKHAAAASSVTQTAAAAKSATISWVKPTGLSSYKSFTITGYKIGIGGSYTAAEKNAEAGSRTAAANATSYTITGLGTGRMYYVAVYYYYNYVSSGGYSYTGKGYYLTTVKTTPAKVIGLDQSDAYTTASRSGLSFDWNQMQNVDGYQYVIYNGSKKIATSTTRTASASFSGTDAGVTYKVVVRGYNEINGKKVYGAWSDPLYMVPQAKVTGISINANKKTMKVSWEKVYGAKQYDIYVSTTGRRTGYKKVATIKDANKLATNLSSVGGQKFDKQKTYYVYIKVTKNIGGKDRTSMFAYCWHN
jgi:hypothetical protein